MGGFALGVMLKHIEVMLPGLWDRTNIGLELYQEKTRRGMSRVSQRMPRIISMLMTSDLPAKS